MRQIGVVLLLVACAHAFSPSSISPADARRGLTAFSKALNGALSKRPSFATLSKAQVQQAEGISVECQVAIAGVGAAVEYCGEVPKPPTQETLEAFCAANCTGGVDAAINNVMTVCNNPTDRPAFESEGFQAAFRAAQSAVKLVCLKEGNAFCFPMIGNVDGGIDFETLSQKQLDDLCNPCIHKLVMAAAEVGGQAHLQAAALEAMCHKISGKYCLLETRDAMMSMVDINPETADFNKIAGVFCSPCFRATITKMAIFAALAPADPEDPTAGDADLEMVLQMFTLLCSRDESGNFCMNRMKSIMAYAMQYGEQVPCPDMDAITPDSTCSADCKVFIQGYVQAGGCCTRPIFSTFGSDTPITWAQGKCGIVVPQTCQSLRVKGRLVLRNLRYDYVQANKDKVHAAIKNDLGAFFDAAPSDVTITGIAPNTPAPAGGFALLQQSADGLAVNYEVVPSDKTHANTISAKAQTATSAPLASIAALPLTAREDPSQPLSFDDASKEDIVVEGAAAGLKAGVAVAIAVVAAAVANLF